MGEVVMFPADFAPPRRVHFSVPWATGEENSSPAQIFSQLLKSWPIHPGCQENEDPIGGEAAAPKISKNGVMI
jgi:hypothetical protein